MRFNLTLPSFDGLSDESSIGQIKGYLTVLNEQLRYMMLNIDEDNLSGALGDAVGNVANAGKLIGELNEKVTLMEKSISRLGEKLSDIEGKTSRITLLDNGSLTVDTGLGYTPLSFGITGDEGTYVLTVYGDSGNALGCVELS